MKHWSSWFAEGNEPEQLTVIRRHTEKGLPYGREPLLKKLARKAGRVTAIEA